MNIPGNQSKILSMLLALLSLFVFVFFTKNIYSDLVMNMAVNEESTIKQEDTTNRLDALSQKSKDLKKLAGGAETAKYMKGLNEDEIIKELYGYVEEESQAGELKILSSSFAEGALNELGFYESKITLNVRVPNMKALGNFLDFIVENKDYKFFITHLNLPRETDKKFNISIPITYFYHKGE